MPVNKRAGHGYDRGRLRSSDKSKMMKHVEWFMFSLMIAAVCEASLDFYVCLQQCHVRTVRASMLEKGMEDGLQHGAGQDVQLHLKNGTVITPGKQLVDWQEKGLYTALTINENTLLPEAVASFVAKILGESMDLDVGDIVSFDDMAITEHQAMLYPGLFIPSL